MTDAAEELDFVDVTHGVSVPWLAQAFGLSPSMVRDRLRGCKPLARRTSGHLYPFADAVSYLVAPRADLMTYVRQMKPSDLPPELQTAVWAAQLKRQSWEAKAGRLWEQKDVMGVLTRLFARVRMSILLWPDSIAGRLELDDETRAGLEKACDKLLLDLTEEVRDLAQQDSPESILSRLGEILPGEVSEEEDILGDLA